MKQKYMQPIVEIMPCQLQGAICAGSSTPKTIVINPGEVAGAGEVGF